MVIIISNELNLTENVFDSEIRHVSALLRAGIVFNEGQTWLEQRRFTIKVLRDFGFGKQSMEEAVGNEVRDLITYFR